MLLVILFMIKPYAQVTIFTLNIFIFQMNLYEGTTFLIFIENFKWLILIINMINLDENPGQVKGFWTHVLFLFSFYWDFAEIYPVWSNSRDWWWWAREFQELEIPVAMDWYELWSSFKIGNCFIWKKLKI